jgi:hypothetical protein
MKIMMCLVGALTSFVPPSEAHAGGCTPNHELHRIMPKYLVVVLDGGDIKRVMFVDGNDERLSTWKPGHNITFCPDENKMINTTINSVATLVPEFSTTSCKTLFLSDEIDRALESAWKFANEPYGNPTMFVAEAKSKLGWYYEVCTDHLALPWEKDDFKDFLTYADSLTRINMRIEDPAHESTYMERAAKYEKWRHALYAAEAKKSWLLWIWQRFFAPN